MPFSTSISALKNLFPVRARQQGGYERMGIPNANDPVANRDMYVSDRPTHVGNMSAQEFNAANAKRIEDRREQLRQADRQAGGLRHVVSARTNPVDKKWDAFFGALQNSGVDMLRTGAAAGWERSGPQQVANAKGDHSQMNTFTTQRKGGWFDSEPVSALKQQGINYLQASDANRNAAQFSQFNQDELARNERAKYLDQQDAAKGRFNRRIF